MCRRPPPAEVAIDAGLVRHLLRTQTPDLASLPLDRVGVGWDNVIYRLGPDHSVRLPRRSLRARLIAVEARWLPVVADRLPLAVPVPQRIGEPDEIYPWPWTVCSYVPGRAVGANLLAGEVGLRAADDLAAFLCALHVPAPAAAPANEFRGVPLATRADTVRRALASAPDDLAGVASRAWSLGIEADPYSGPPRWVHGDLHNLNVLTAGGGITGVLDFGDLCAGDPSTDLAAAWMLLDRPARQRLVALLPADRAAWARARGWAAFFGLVFIEHSRSTPDNAEIGRRILTEVAADCP